MYMNHVYYTSLLPQIRLITKMNRGLTLNYTRDSDVTYTLLIQKFAFKRDACILQNNLRARYISL